MRAVDIMDNPIDFRAANTMLNPNPFTSNRLVFRPFVISAQALAWFLLGLAHRDTRRFIALKAGIFVHDTVGRNVIVFFVRCRCIVRFAGAGVTASFDLLGALLGDTTIFDGMPLFLAAVVRFLALRIVRAPDRAFGAITDAFQTRTGFQYLRERSRFPCWQLLCVP